MTSANECLLFSAVHFPVRMVCIHISKAIFCRVFCIGTLPHVSDCLILLLTNMNIAFSHRRAVAVLGTTSGCSGSGATASVLVAANP